MRPGWYSYTVFPYNIPSPSEEYMERQKEFGERIKVLRKVYGNSEPEEILVERITENKFSCLRSWQLRIMRDSGLFPNVNYVGIDDPTFDLG